MYYFKHIYTILFLNNSNLKLQKNIITFQSLILAFNKLIRKIITLVILTEFNFWIPKYPKIGYKNI